MLSGIDACITGTTIEVGRSQLWRTARWPFGKLSASWPAGAVAAVYVVAQPPGIEVLLLGGEAAELA